jgi:hypothetical protein
MVGHPFHGGRTVRKNGTADASSGRCIGRLRLEIED